MCGTRHVVLLNKDLNIIIVVDRNGISGSAVLTRGAVLCRPRLGLATLFLAVVKYSVGITGFIVAKRIGSLTASILAVYADGADARLSLKLARRTTLQATVEEFIVWQVVCKI
jgi:hypothetical protein